MGGTLRTLVLGGREGITTRSKWGVVSAERQTSVEVYLKRDK